MAGLTVLKPLANTMADAATRFAKVRAPQPFEPAYNSVLNAIDEHFGHLTQLHAAVLRMSSGDLGNVDDIAGQQREISRLAYELACVGYKLDDACTDWLELAEEYAEVETDPHRSEFWKGMLREATDIRMDVFHPAQDIDNLFANDDSFQSLRRRDEPATVG